MLWTSLLVAVTISPEELAQPAPPLVPFLQHERQPPPAAPPAPPAPPVASPPPPSHEPPVVMQLPELEVLEAVEIASPAPEDSAQAGADTAPVTASVPPPAKTVPSAAVAESEQSEPADAPTPQRKEPRAPSQSAGLLPEIEAKRERIVEAFRHAWGAYESVAMGHDEVRPVSNRPDDPWGGFGATLVDALDTMIMMGLDEEVARAKEYVMRIDFGVDYEVSFFETTIRFLGGLLSAHALTGDADYLAKAKELADNLMPNFESTPTGLPQSMINLKTHAAHNHGWNGQSSILAEVGSCQLEFAYLSDALGDPRYAEASRKVYTFLSRQRTDYPGLYPVFMHPSVGDFRSQRITLGGLSDSFYEYLLKLYVLTAKSGDADKVDHAALEMYNAAVESIQQHMVRRVRDSDGKVRVFVNELQSRRADYWMEHLSCFFPGLLALGVMTGNRLEKEVAASSGRVLSSAERKLIQRRSVDTALARDLTKTCVDTYFSQPTGLGPESIRFSGQNGVNPNRVYWADQRKYILRPETIESVFLMHRLTGEPQYRDWAFQIFLSIEEQCRTPHGYSGLRDVTRDVGLEKKLNWDDKMESFFFAETLKYLFLIFSSDDALALDDFVFNTECHPLAVIK